MPCWSESWGDWLKAPGKGNRSLATVCIRSTSEDLNPLGPSVPNKVAGGVHLDKHPQRKHHGQVTDRRL